MDFQAIGRPGCFREEQMHIRQLEAFHATMITGTITKAAKMLYVSQPSVSRLISNLEEELGFSLFERKKRRLYPTAEGVKFYSELKKVYDSIDSLKNYAVTIKDKKESFLRISATPAIAISLLPKAIKIFKQSHPHTYITLNSRGPTRIMTDLMENRCDIAFCNTRAYMPEIVQEKLIDAECVCALPPEHRLGDKEIIRPEDLNGETLVELDSSREFFWEHHTKLFEMNGISINRGYSTQRSFAAYSLVLEGLGLAIIEPFSAGLWEKLGVVVKPFHPPIRYPYSVSFPSEKAKSGQALVFVNTVKEYLKNNPPGSHPPGS